MQPGTVKALAIGVAIAAGAAALYVWRKGGVAAAAEGLGELAVDAVGGVASGVVGGIGASVGLPTPSDTTTDAQVARWIIDNVGWFAASKWSGAPALFEAMGMPEGSGKPPPPGTPAYAEFVTNRTAAPAPAPAPSATSTTWPWSTATTAEAWIKK